MDGPGTITWEEFTACAEELVRMSETISDYWQLLGDKNLPGQAYLTRKEKIFISVEDPLSKLSEKYVDREPDDEWEENLEGCDPYEVPSSSEERPLILEHHILWSMSYSVPVIYFNGWRSDYPGINPISVEVAQKLLKNEKLAYNELSQAIHPLLDRPFLHLHPCGSRELLQSTRKSANRLVSWLSAVAPAALNLRLSPRYFQLTLTNGTKSQPGVTTSNVTQSLRKLGPGDAFRIIRQLAADQ